MNGMHTDLDKPPNNSMFKKAGGSTPSTKSKQSGSESISPEVAQALTQAATQVSSAIVTAFTPQSASSGHSISQTGISPARVIKIAQNVTHSSLIYKISDLKACLVIDEDYFHKKDAIIWGY